MVFHLRQFLIMKTAIFNKKRIVIAISILFILTIVISLCSFAPPSFSDQSEITVSIPSQIDLENLMSIANLQHELGYFNNLIPVACFMNTSNNQLRLILTRSDVDFSFSLSSGSWVFTGGADNGSYYRMYFTSDGFSLQKFASTSVRSDRLLFYRSSLSSPFVVNSAYLFSDSQNGQDSISDVANYYSELYNIVFNYEDNLSSAESVGYSEGYSEGESNGYSEGYPDGYDTGFNHGYQFGYQDGIATGRSEGYIHGEAAGYGSGYDTGYQDGYDIGLDDGYESGYSEGYETGYDDGMNNSDFNKPGQIKAYFWRYRNDSDFQGNVYFSSSVNEFGTTLYRWCSREELETHWQGFTIFEFTYDTNLFFQNNPLEFDYYIPQIVRDNGAAAYSIKEVKYEYVDLYERRAFVELSLDPSLIGVLNGKYNEGLNDSNALINGVSDIATKPIKSLKDALDFDIFGINIGAVAVGLVAILFAIWAYNKIRKFLPI